MDVTNAVEQGQIADTLVAPIDHGEETENQTSTEAVESPEVEEQPVKQAEQLEEEPDDWLPEEQEKVFPDEVLLRYAQRYGRDENWLSDPLNRQLIVDKINTDIYLRERQNQEEFEPEQEQIQQERLTPQPIPVPQWLNNATQFVRANQLNHPEVAQAFAKNFMAAFGVNDMPKDVNAEALAETFSVFGMNLINSLIPMWLQAPSPEDGQNMFQYFVGQHYPNLSRVDDYAGYENVWEQMRQTDPRYLQLPDFGSKEFRNQTRELAKNFAGSPEQFERMVFTDQHGRPLPKAQNAQYKYQMLANMMLGQKPDPAMMKKAVATGQKLARQSQVRKQAGNLGAGQSKQQISSGEDDFFSNPASWSNYLDKAL